MPPAPPGCWWHGREQGRAGSRGGEALCVAVDARSFLRRNGHGPAGRLRSFPAEKKASLELLNPPPKRSYDFSGRSPSLTGGHGKADIFRMSAFVFCGLGPWASDGGKRETPGEWPCCAAGQAWEMKEGAYCRIWRGMRPVRRFPPGIAGSPLGQATGMTAYAALFFYRSGNKVPPRQTATETFHTAQKKVFSGVGESLTGGGDSFYKKRPRPLSMMPPRQRRASLRGRPYRLRQWQGCPRSWPARRGCAWKGGPGRSR